MVFPPTPSSHYILEKVYIMFVESGKCGGVECGVWWFQRKRLLGSNLVVLLQQPIVLVRMRGRAGQQGLVSSKIGGTCIASNIKYYLVCKYIKAKNCFTV